MISSQRLRTTLAYLDAQYNATQNDPDPIKPILYCKMALLELCGWLEECFDSIAHTAIPANSSHPATHFFREKINSVHGFTYQGNSRSILLSTLGVAGLSALEDAIDENGNLDSLKGWLTTLNNHRRELAHTHLGTFTPYDSPALVLQKLDNIEPIIIDISHLCQA